MHETWDPERLLRSCDTTERHTDATRDLLTKPRWGKWEGVAEVDARDVRVPIHTARPGKVACRVAIGMGLLLAGWVLKEAVLLLWEAAGWLWGWRR